MNRKFSLLLTAAFTVTMFWQISTMPIYAQNNPLTLGQVTTSLNVSGDKKKESAITAKKVRQVGVTFPLTSEIEAELRTAGATDELIEAIRQKLVTNSKSTPPPTPMPTPAKQKNASLKTIKNSIGMEFVKISPGSFMMGSDNKDDEKPIHRVTIKNTFYIGKYEVTIGEWKKLMGVMPEGMDSDLDDKFKENDRQPVVRVSWNDAKEFIRKLNAKNDGYEYRLPSEAEWEYAARAGTTSDFAFGNDLSSDQADFDGNYPSGNAKKGKFLEKTNKVGSYQPNTWGLYDMHGNVWEWVEDIYSAGYSAVNLPTDGSPNLSGENQDLHVLRGGSWNTFGTDCRSAARKSSTAADRYNSYGFRVAARAR